MLRFFSEHPGCWFMLLLIMAKGTGNAQTPLKQPVIERIYATANPAQDSVFRLGSTITLEVRGLSPWMTAQEERLVRQGFDVQKAHAKARNLVLYIDDAPLIGMPPLTVYTDETAGVAPSPAEMQAAASTGPDKVIFQLQRNVSNYRYWNVVYGSPWDFSYPGKIGIGYEDQVFTELYPGKTATIRLELIQPGSLWLSLLSIGALAFGTLVLASRSWLLREAAGQTALTVAIANPPYSLAKIQLAWWTFIIMGSYLLIYCATGEMADISATSLALLGISAGTTALNGLVAPTPPPAKKARAANVAPQSRGWLMDVLSDEHGVSMHRLQKLVITVVMGYFFVRCVHSTVAMPVWTNNQMLLLAVSNATYLGLKWQENRSYGEDETGMLPNNQLFASPPRGMPPAQSTSPASSFESYQGAAGEAGNSSYAAETFTQSLAPQEPEMTQVDGHTSNAIVGSTNSVNLREG